MSTGCRIGLDESGKGDYFGPLVVAAVAADPEQEAVLRTWGVRDSKRLSDSRVKVLARQIRSLPHVVVLIGPERYNRLYQEIGNLNRLLAWAHARALENLLEQVDCSRAIADQFGDRTLIESRLMARGRTIRLDQRPQAEAEPVVAAASILARAGFLEGLERLGTARALVLPKGAGPAVITAARQLIDSYGEDELARVAKLHFKTTASLKGSRP